MALTAATLFVVCVAALGGAVPIHNAPNTQNFDFQGHYVMVDETHHSRGVTLTLEWTGYAEHQPISPLHANFYYWEDIVHIKISDPNEIRWEVPNTVVTPDPPNVSSRLYDLEFDTAPFSFRVVRKSTGDAVFNSSPLLYSDQYIDFGTSTWHDSPVYGPGEFTAPLLLDRNDVTYTLFNTESYLMQYVSYSSHPFYMELRAIHDDPTFGTVLAENARAQSCGMDERLRVDCGYPGVDEGQCHRAGCCWSPSHQDGIPWCFYSSSGDGISRAATTYAHGVFLLNSNAMDIVAKKDSMTFKAVGGIVDAYIMLGPTPDDVTRQYHTIIGTPAMMPRWALGFHQCRYGYDSLSEVEEVVSQYKKHDLPLDVMWVDIDYMDEYRTFTLDESRYPSSRFRSLADDLHAAGQRLVLIVDPGVKVDPGYGTYDRGIEQGIFIRNTDLDPLVAKMWPGLVVHPDFTHPGADAFWEGEIRAFQEKVGFDGLWLDVNEITSFCDGRCVLKAEEEDGAYLFSCACNSQQWQDNPYDQPAYLPGVFTRMCRTDKVKGLDCGTLSMTARHYGNDGYGKHSLEYNYHNLYGTNEANATASALRQVTGERPFVLTRATFPGVGRVAAHWTGDNHSHHRDLITSLSEVMLFSLIGVPATGADVCGFHDDTTTELCARWMQAASLAYPFYRNHNNPTTIAQEPYALGEPLLSISRDTLRLRYSLVMYLYSEFHHVHKQGGALIRPLFLEYPTDTTTFGIDQQFLVGTRGLLVSPALAQGQRRVDAYFPVGSTWFDFFTGDVAVSLSDDSRLLSLDVPLDKMPVHVRAGNIIPIQEPRRTTPELSASPISLLIAVEPTTFSPLLANPAAATAATGRIMWDDGVSEDESTRLVIDLAASRTSSGMLVTGTVIRDGYKGQVPEISEVHVYGGSCSPLSIGPFPINKSFQIEYLC